MMLKLWHNDGQIALVLLKRHFVLVFHESRWQDKEHTQQCCNTPICFNRNDGPQPGFSQAGQSRVHEGCPRLHNVPKRLADLVTAPTWNSFWSLLSGKDSFPANLPVTVHGFKCLSFSMDRKIF
jgi:hypothetical protein